MTKLPKSNLGRSVRHFSGTQSEFKSRERFAALRPIASRIRRRILELPIYWDQPVSPCLQLNDLKLPDLLLPRSSLFGFRPGNRMDCWPIVKSLSGLIIHS